MGVIDKLTGKAKKAAADAKGDPELRRRGEREQEKGQREQQAAEARREAERREQEAEDIGRHTH